MASISGLCRWASLAAMLPVVLAATAQDGSSETPGPLAAEIMPLAARSLLLDVTRSASGRIVAVGERGHVVLSDDGSVWTQAEYVPTRATLTTITTAGTRLLAAGHDSVIIASDDDGQTWKLLYEDIERQQPVMDLLVTADGTLMAAGAYSLLLASMDNGESWEEYATFDEEWHLNALVDQGEQGLLMVGEAGLAYRSLDGGANWEVIELPYPGSMWGLVASGACSLAFGLRGNIQETCDAGASWKLLDSGVESSLAAGASGAGVSLFAGNSGTIALRDTDGSFTHFTHSSGADMAGALAMPDGTWLLVGEGGSHRFPEPPAEQP